jgi:hypothetical protein
MLIPMAVSLGFGVIFATVITLLMVPAYYLILDDAIQAVQGRLRGSREQGPERGEAGLPAEG